jgi:UDP-3-O-[3-hydroxymyristoyl] N-acetylglucosamine deacetylase
VSGPVRLRGHGVHGGRPATVRLHRRDGPVAFRRAGRELAPRAGNVVGTAGCTVLGGDGVRLATVEHLLAALHVRGVWEGLLIEVEGDELPILDGSAAPWDAALAQLGPLPPPPAPAPAQGEAHGADGAWACLAPGPRELVVTISFDHPAIGRQAWSGRPGAWAELLAARTFGFARDAAALRAAERAAGASEANAIIFGDDAPTVPLRFPDEPVRHKALDALGDLYLLGRPFAGRLEIRRGGHALHHRLVTAIAARGNATEGSS